MAQEKPVVEAKTPPKAKISVDYRPGRWGKVFHLFGPDGGEIVLQQSDAVLMARTVLKIAGQKQTPPK